MIIDAGPFIVDGEKLNSRLWALMKRAAERGEELHTTHPVLAQVLREPPRQANLARALRHLGLPRGEVTSGLWCREVPQREDVRHAQAVPQGVP